MPKETKTRSGKAAAGGKAKKDPNAPKRSLSAYMHFSQDQRATVKEENPDVTFGEIGKILGAKWKELPEDERAPYEEKAKADKARYEKEKAAYEAENPDAAPAKAAPKKKAPAKKAKKASSDDDDEEDDKVDEDDEDDEWSVLPATSPPLTPRGLTFSRAKPLDAHDPPHTPFLPFLHLKAL
ncbi:hypothetical protein Rhopal_006817-T1 [Rhodotorula paludigena]|uniref:HMG box domain-containing protein n=1 Tax=Rhodotorula paludigena TaxID=86838 RepID=A0AAV5GV09_9BASI|nr:hypothetical protein Rhopal_006817-T1 [Rhodotorula paludigena]